MSTDKNDSIVMPAVNRRRLLSFAGALAAVGVSGRLWADYPKPTTSQPRAPGQAKHLIVLWMNGGASHIDTLDPKKGETAGEFKAIATKTPGLSICEHLPQLATVSDKLAVIRSLTSKEGNHQRARYLGHTGYPPNPTVKYPAIGSFLGKEFGTGSSLPSFVSIDGPSASAGFLGVEHAPFVHRKAGELPNNVGHAFGVTSNRFDHRRDGLDFLDDRFKRATGSSDVDSRRDVVKRAIRMMRSPQLKAFQLHDEPEAVKAAYGDTDFGRGCLLARRLVEAGVSVVEVTLDGWDTHQDNFNRVKGRLDIVDPAIATLIKELDERGRLKDTLVLWMGDFGRTPRINGNEGRDHHPKAFSAIMAGAGVRRGLVYGETDERGANVTKDPVSVADIQATIVDRFGLDPHKLSTSPGGRPVALTTGKVVAGLLG